MNLLDLIPLIQTTLHAVVEAVTDVDSRGIVAEKAEDIRAAQSVVSSCSMLLGELADDVEDGILDDPEAVVQKWEDIKLKIEALVVEVQDWKAPSEGDPEE